MNQFSLKYIAELIGAKVEKSHHDKMVKGVAPIEDATSGDITFLAHNRYTRYLRTTLAGFIILPENFVGEYCPVALRVSNPYLAFAKVVSLFNPRSPEDIADGIHSTAVLGKDVRLGEKVSLGSHVVIGDRVMVGDGTRIGAGTVIMAGCHIGTDCVFYPNVTLMDGIRVGDRVILHSGVVLGSDGFGFAPDGKRYYKITQIGNVVVEDDVEIGAGTTVDRAVMGSTCIKRGVKIDNLVQIAHNVIIGEDTVIAAQAGFSGSVRVGRNCRIGGQAGFVGHITVGDGASIGAQAGVTGDVEEGMQVSGYPARPHQAAMRSLAAQTKLPELIKRLRALEDTVRSLKGTTD